MSESKFAERTAATKKMLGAAAQLAKKQAELATLNNVTLPKLYYAIGKAIVGKENLPPELAVHRDKIRALEAGIAAKPDAPQSTAAEGFAAKAKQFAQQAAKKAAKATADAAANMQIQAAYVALGKKSADKYGTRAIPKDCAEAFTAALASRESLTQEIIGLRKSSAFGMFTPMRVLAGAGLCLLCLAAWFMPFIGHKPRPDARVAAAREQTKKSNAGSIEVTGTREASRSDNTTSASPTHAAAETSKRPANSLSIAKLAVAELLQPQSQHYREFGYDTIKLGQSFDAMASQKQLIPAPGEPWAFQDKDGTQYGFSENKTLVYLRRQYQGGAQDYRDQINDRFGPHDREPTKRTLNHQYGTDNFTVLRYTFPKVLVTVSFITSSTNRRAGLPGNNDTTYVSVVDREWAEDILVRTAQSQYECACWMAYASTFVRKGELTEQSMRGLKGVRWSEEPQSDGQRWAIIVDLGLEKEHENEPAGTFKKISAAVVRIVPNDQQNIPNGQKSSISVYLSRYSSSKVPAFLHRGESDLFAKDMRFYAIEHLPLLNFLAPTLSLSLMEIAFPPKGDSVQLITRAGTFAASWYEWNYEDESGTTWVVRYKFSPDEGMEMELLGKRQL